MSQCDVLLQRPLVLMGNSLVLQQPCAAKTLCFNGKQPCAAKTLCFNGKQPCAAAPLCCEDLMLSVLRDQPSRSSLCSKKGDTLNATVVRECRMEQKRPQQLLEAWSAIRSRRHVREFQAWYIAILRTLQEFWKIFNLCILRTYEAASLADLLLIENKLI